MIYLDNSATTQPSQEVIGAMRLSLEEGFYNPSAAYEQALGVEKQLNECREKILGALNAKNAKVIFTSGGTESNNLALFGSFYISRKPFDIAVSAGEHPSVYDTAEHLAKLGARAHIISLRKDGSLDMDALETRLKEGLNLLSVMQVNNETGAINDIPEIARMVKQLCPDCRLHVDGVQGFLREETDFVPIDMYTLSAHKIHGPKGVGALVIKKNLRLDPFHVGGGQEEGIRSGTENTSGIIGLSRAIDEMLSNKSRREYLMGLKLGLLNAIQSLIPEAIVNGPKPEAGACHILNMSFPNVRGETMLHALEQKGVLVSTGSACSSKKTRVSRVLTQMGISPKLAEGAIRFSLSVNNTLEEMNAAAQAACECYSTLVKYQRR